MGFDCFAGTISYVVMNLFGLRGVLVHFVFRIVILIVGIKVWYFLINLLPDKYSKILVY